MPQNPVSDYFLDTNPIVRLVSGDPPDMAAKAERMFQRAARREFTLHLTALVVGEAVYVLTSFYDLPRGSVAQALIQVIDLPGLKVPEAAVLKRGLELFAATPSLHFVDAYLTAKGEAEEAGVSSSDAAIRKTGLVPVLDPMDEEGNGEA